MFRRRAGRNEGCEEDETRNVRCVGDVLKGVCECLDPVDETAGEGEWGLAMHDTSQYISQTASQSILVQRLYREYPLVTTSVGRRTKGFVRNANHPCLISRDLSNLPGMAGGWLWPLVGT